MKINLSFTFCVIVGCVYVYCLFVYRFIDSMTWLGGAVTQEFAQSTLKLKVEIYFSID